MLWLCGRGVCTRGGVVAHHLGVGVGSLLRLLRVQQRALVARRAQAAPAQPGARLVVLEVHRREKELVGLVDVVLRLVEHALELEHLRLVRGLEVGEVGVVDQRQAHRLQHDETRYLSARDAGAFDT